MPHFECGAFNHSATCPQVVPLALPPVEACRDLHAMAAAHKQNRRHARAIHTDDVN
jgi:hypothetical protein